MAHGDVRQSVCGCLSSTKRELSLTDFAPFSPNENKEAEVLLSVESSRSRGDYCPE